MKRKHKRKRNKFNHDDFSQSEEIWKDNVETIKWIVISFLIIFGMYIITCIIENFP